MGEAVSAPIWVRHRASLFWCVAAEFEASIVTLCRGRFDAGEDYAVDTEPEPNTRCRRCDLELMRRKLRATTASTERGAPFDDPQGMLDVERGLAELVRNAPEPTRIEFDQLEEFGGEG
jgi:hypothetical protein